MQIYTDGACKGNPGPGGWAFVVIDGGKVSTISGNEKHSTNNRMEMRAVAEALMYFNSTRTSEDTLDIFSDSALICNTINLKWYVKWMKNGWKNSQKQPIANKDLWLIMLALYLEMEGMVIFTKVKGHSGNEYNELADRYATRAAGKI